MSTICRCYNHFVCVYLWENLILALRSSNNLPSDTAAAMQVIAAALQPQSPEQPRHKHAMDPATVLYRREYWNRNNYVPGPL